MGALVFLFLHLPHSPHSALLFALHNHLLSGELLVRDCGGETHTPPPSSVQQKSAIFGHENGQIRKLFYRLRPMFTGV